MYFSFMYKKFVIILVLLWSATLVSQKIIAVRSDFVPFEADNFIGFDGFKNYFYTKDNVIYKKSEVTILQYQNLSLGKISKVDIINPLKVIVFYEEFNSVIVLDNFLNEIQKIEFSSLETPVLASGIGISGQNKLWVFNALNQQIGLYDLNSNTYQNLSIPIKDNILYYQTSFNYFEWIDNQNNWKSCSIYGTIIPNGKTEATSNLQILDGKSILFLKSNTLYISDRTKGIFYEIEIVEKSFQDFYYKDQILSIFTNKGITNYKITIP